jgi:TfoX/Sxy family transcriptional regulator of competence genes
MAYDEGLAERIRGVIDGRSGVSEKKMFGGVAFLVHGNMFVGIVKDELMVRVGPEAHPAALKRPHVRPMDFTGKPMAGYVFVSPAGLDEDAELERWIDLGARFVATLPRKPATAPKKTKRKSARRAT